MRRRRQRFRRGDAVEVHWVDHTGSGGWVTDRDADISLTTIRSVGMFLRRDQRTTTIALSMDDQKPASKTNDRLTVGNTMIRKIRKLRG